MSVLACLHLEGVNYLSEENFSLPLSNPLDPDTQIKSADVSWRL